MAVVETHETHLAAIAQEVVGGSHPAKPSRSLLRSSLVEALEERALPSGGLSICRVEQPHNAGGAAQWRPSHRFPRAFSKSHCPLPRNGFLVESVAISDY
jgi:hypothetical protein